MILYTSLYFLPSFVTLVAAAAVVDADVGEVRIGRKTILSFLPAFPRVFLFSFLFNSNVSGGIVVSILGRRMMSFFVEALPSLFILHPRRFVVVIVVDVDVVSVVVIVVDAVVVSNSATVVLAVVVSALFMVLLFDNPIFLAPFAAVEDDDADDDFVSIFGCLFFSFSSASLLNKTDDFGFTVTVDSDGLVR